MIARQIFWRQRTPIWSRGFCSTARSTAPKHRSTEGRHPGFARRVPRRQPQPPPKNDTSGNTPLSSNAAISNALATHDSGLLSPVSVPRDPHGILLPTHPVTAILANSAIVIQRQLEMMNVMLGFEQANKYVIMDGQGNHIGYLAEQDHGIGNALARQALRTHRSFTTHVFDKHENEVLRFHRPFSWISSRIRVYDATSPTDQSFASSALSGTSPGSIANQTAAQVSARPHSDMRIIGEAQQQWAPLRRKYNLFLHRDLAKEPSDPDAPQLTAGDLPLSNSKAIQVAEAGNEDMGFAQFAYVNEPFLSWDFSLKSSDDRLIGSVNRNFAGFAREIFTDTGVYALRMDSAGLAVEPNHLISQTARTAPQPETTGMTLDQRAVMLATAVTIDFDYFSRHSHTGSTGFMPIWFPMGGGAEESGAVGGAAEGGVSAGEGALGEGAKTGAVTGAGTMAGVEATQHGQDPYAGSPVNSEADDAFWSGFDKQPQDGFSHDGRDESDRSPPSGSSDGGGGGDGGGGESGSWSDFFDI